MSIAEVLPKSSPKLAAVPDVEITQKIVVTIDDNNVIIVSPPNLTLKWNTNGQITWSLPSTHAFQAPGIQFSGVAPFVVQPLDPQNPQTCMAYFNNSNPFQQGMFAYTVSVDGFSRTDPTVENDPPPQT